MCPPPVLQWDCCPVPQQKCGQPPPSGHGDGRGDHGAPPSGLLRHAAAELHQEQRFHLEQRGHKQPPPPSSSLSRPPCSTVLVWSQRGESGERSSCKCWTLSTLLFRKNSWKKCSFSLNSLLWQAHLIPGATGPAALSPLLLTVHVRVCFSGVMWASDVCSGNVTTLWHTLG